MGHGELLAFGISSVKRGSTRSWPANKPLQRGRTHAVAIWGVAESRESEAPSDSAADRRAPLNASPLCSQRGLSFLAGDTPKKESFGIRRRPCLRPAGSIRPGLRNDEAAVPVRDRSTTPFRLSPSLRSTVCLCRHSGRCPSFARESLHSGRPAVATRETQCSGLCSLCHSLLVRIRQPLSGASRTRRCALRRLRRVRGISSARGISRAAPVVTTPCVDTGRGCITLLGLPFVKWLGRPLPDGHFLFSMGSSTRRARKVLRLCEQPDGRSFSDGARWIFEDPSAV